MIKDLWAKISYFFFIGMLVLVGFICGDLKVNASAIINWSSKQSRAWYDINGVESTTTWTNDPQTISLNQRVTALQYRVTLPQEFTPENSYTFKVGFRANPDTLIVSRVEANFQNDTDEFPEVSCSQWVRDDNGSYFATCTTSPFSVIPSGNRLYFKIYFMPEYVTSLRSTIYGFDERLGTNAIITQQTNIINNSINNLTNNVNNLDDTMKDDSITSPNAYIEDFEDLLPSSGPITRLLTIPAQLFGAVVSSINTTCSPYRLRYINNSYIDLPCFSIGDYLGSSFESVVDLLMFGLLFWKIIKTLIKVFEQFTSMKEGDVIGD